MATIAGLFERYEDADRALVQINELGYGKDDINVIAPENMIKSKLADKGDAKEDTAKTGALVGGLAGLLVGVGTILVPGVGPILTAGALATALGSTAVGAGIGAAAGGFRGSLKEMGLPDADATILEEGVKNGGILVTVIVEGEDHIRRVKEIMRSSNAVDLESRRNIMERETKEQYDEITGIQRDKRSPDQE